jgi:2-oxoglutarate ferredoxin oxidoreductase subunit delta
LQVSPNINAQGYHYVVLIKDNCTGCSNCALVCPDAVITVYRESKKKKVPIATISNVMQNIQVTIDDTPAVEGSH